MSDDSGGVVLTYHLVPQADYDSQAATYLPAAWERDGFIHTTKQVALLHEVGNRYYRADPRPYLVLTIDLARTAIPWRYDAAGADYPHLYGPLERAAIVAVQPMSRAADGRFLPLQSSD